MEFLAYDGESTGVSWRDRGDGAGVRGMVTSSQPPIGKSDTRAGITEVAYAFLGRDPKGTIYITDSDNRLLETVLNESYHKSVMENARRQAMSWALLFLCVMCFLGTLTVGLHWGGLGLFVFIAMLYLASVRLGIQNEIESAVICTIILLLILIKIPAIMEARERAQQQRAAKQSQTPEAAVKSVSEEEPSSPGR